MHATRVLLLLSQEQTRDLLCTGTRHCRRHVTMFQRTQRAPGGVHVRSQCRRESTALNKHRR